MKVGFQIQKKSDKIVEVVLKEFPNRWAHLTEVDEKVVLARCFGEGFNDVAFADAVGAFN